MAEGWARHLLRDKIEPYSAGIEAHGMNPNAVKVMAEAGVDITGQSSKLAATLADVDFDLVISVCGHADENCPAFLGKSLPGQRPATKKLSAIIGASVIEIREFVSQKLAALL
jgi:protein-tyrosine-phosphatase